MIFRKLLYVFLSDRQEEIGSELWSLELVSTADISVISQELYLNMNLKCNENPHFD